MSKSENIQKITTSTFIFFLIKFDDQINLFEKGKILMCSLVRPRNTCDWEWTEWSSCSSFCNLDGSKPEDAPTKKKREQVPRWIKVPQQLCRGAAEEMCPPTPCISKAQGLTHL